MILASAQTNSKEGDINSNLSDHYKMIDVAAKNGTDLIVFPELSITGYTRDKALELFFVPNDNRLSKLRRLSVDKQIIIVAGAPIRIENKLYIGSFIIKPDNTVEIYTKQFLHEGEDQYYQSSFIYNPTIQLKNEQFSFAICADINHSIHIQNAKASNSSIYLASIFWSLNGMPNTFETLSSYARKNQMCVLISNSYGTSWGMQSGGQSAMWNNKGHLIGKLDVDNPGLLIVEFCNNKWLVQSIAIK